MGTFSLTKMGRLFWLGRYTERAYGTQKASQWLADCYLDNKEGDYAEYCRKMGIPNIYTSTYDFCERYLKDKSNPNSIISSLGYAYDNAIVLRETIGTDTLSYIQMAIYAMDKCIKSDSPSIEVQWMLDDIMAFRGCCDECIDDEACRNIIRTGTSLERLDLMLRMEKDMELCRKECSKLLNRLYKTPLQPNQKKLDFLIDHLLTDDAPEVDKNELLHAVETLFPDI